MVNRKDAALAVLSLYLATVLGNLFLQTGYFILFFGQLAVYGVSLIFVSRVIKQWRNKGNP